MFDSNLLLQKEINNPQQSNSYQKCRERIWDHGQTVCSDGFLNGFRYLIRSHLNSGLVSFSSSGDAKATQHSTSCIHLWPWIWEEQSNVFLIQLLVKQQTRRRRRIVTWWPKTTEKVTGVIFVSWLLWSDLELTRLTRRPDFASMGLIDE